MALGASSNEKSIQNLIRTILKYRIIIEGHTLRFETLMKLVILQCESLKGSSIKKIVFYFERLSIL